MIKTISKIFLKSIIDRLGRDVSEFKVMEFTIDEIKYSYLDKNGTIIESFTGEQSKELWNNINNELTTKYYEN